MTRARKDGSAEKIAAAIQRDRAASDVADRILAECNAGMRLITRAATAPDGRTLHSHGPPTQAA